MNTFLSLYDCTAGFLYLLVTLKTSVKAFLPKFNLLRCQQRQMAI